MRPILILMILVTAMLVTALLVTALLGPTLVALWLAMPALLVVIPFLVRFLDALLQ